MFTKTSREKLASNEKHWAWKAGLRVASTIICLASIICIAIASAEAMTLARTENDLESDLDHYVYDWIEVIWDLIPLGLAIIWNAVYLLILFIRQRPAHPGLAVAFDLLLWLGLLVGNLFAIAGGISVISFTPDQLYSSGGHYDYAENGTYVYISDNAGAETCADFASCADQQKWLDNLHTRGVLEIVGAAAGFVALVIHLALFCWACADTHYRNRNYQNMRARKIAEVMIQEMVEKGQLPPPKQPLVASQSVGPQWVSGALGPQTTAAPEAQPMLSQEQRREAVGVQGGRASPARSVEVEIQRAPQPGVAR
ncbi:hypothetical protein LTS18_007834 [Coniosporium uncinatum]|uniref:Uncharacterized protein n=1 Tax=Coniosporium uncinatum TaxID=93489 RepID=A0ACC3DZJ0_9PEZI|nr:hypothetical protein LTS18_007834 [Coniosporium uncinatum]